MTLTEQVEGALGATFGRAVVIRQRAPLGGGCISRIERIDTTAGIFVLKWLPDGPEGFFDAEAEGLSALARSATPLVVPRVIVSSSTYPDSDPTEPPFVVLEYLRPGSPSDQADFDVRVGQGLAALHRATTQRFGFTRDTYCGATRQPNPWTDRWVDFYAASRLSYQIELAARNDHLDESDRQRADRLLSRLDRWLAEPSEGPALLHGDLWSGNLHATHAGRPGLLDPAAYFGHREAELGMMTLFGGFSPRVFDAYHEAFPLEPGWRERNGLYQLYHVLNHLNLFGQSYYAQAMALVRRYS